jgi:hypothetical protein
MFQLGLTLFFLTNKTGKVNSADAVRGKINGVLTSLLLKLHTEINAANVRKVRIFCIRH